jgi:hypothetical protein
MKLVRSAPDLGHFLIGSFDSSMKEAPQKVSERLVLNYRCKVMDLTIEIT